jgi:Tol biopolymer transport system component
LVPGDTNNAGDIFVHDRLRRTTDRVSVSSRGTQASGGSSHPSISADGRYVFFLSRADDLVSNDNADRTRCVVSTFALGAVDPSFCSTDAFVHDRVTGKTELVSVSSSGERANDTSSVAESQPAISADGRFIVFYSRASSLVGGDTNEEPDVFVRDRVRRTTERVSVSSKGEQAQGGSFWPSISPNGRYVSFSSLAENLAEGARKKEGGATAVDDLYVRDLWMQTTVRVPVSARGPSGSEYPVTHPVLSADGSTIAFMAACLECSIGSLDQIWVHDRPKSVR